MKRPVGVTILAVIAILGGVLNLALALPYLGFTTLAIPVISGTVTGVASGMVLTWGVMMLLLGIFEVAVGVGALQLRSWAWVTGVVVFGLSLIMSIIQLISVGAVAGVAVSAIVAAGVLAYLYSSGVRTAFDHEDGSLFHSGHHTPMGAA